MSTLYEEELKKLIGELTLKIEDVKRRGGSEKELRNLQEEAEVLKERLERYQKAMARFRVKRSTPNHSQTPAEQKT